MRYGLSKTKWKTLTWERYLSTRFRRTIEPNMTTLMDIIAKITAQK